MTTVTPPPPPELPSFNLSNMIQDFTGYWHTATFGVFEASYLGYLFSVYSLRLGVLVLQLWLLEWFHRFLFGSWMLLVLAMLCAPIQI